MSNTTAGENSWATPPPASVAATTNRTAATSLENVVMVCAPWAAMIPHAGGGGAIRLRSGHRGEDADLPGEPAGILRGGPPLLHFRSRPFRAPSRVRGARPVGADRPTDDRGGPEDAVRRGATRRMADAQPRDGGEQPGGDRRGGRRRRRSRRRRRRQRHRGGDRLRVRPWQ